MKYISKKLCLILSIFFMMSIFAFSKAEFKAGKYLGTAPGFGGEIQVEVTVSSDKIEKVEIVKHSESEGISDFAITNIPAEIVEYQSIEVDGAAGATLSSDGIKLAVKNALSHSGVDMAEITKKVEKKIERDLEFDKEAEVVIIGAGGAGLAAGVSAYENGAKSVIIIEKMPAMGGNTIRSGGAMNAVNPTKQKAQGIEDSVDLHYTQTFEGGNKVADPKLVRVMVEEGPGVVGWLESYGLVWREKVGSVIGSVGSRTNQAKEPLGTGFIRVLDEAFVKFGGKIYTETKAVKIIKENGRVVGVNAVDKNGNNIEFKAKKGVIITTGGYAGNIAMIREYLNGGVYTKENLPAELESTNHPGATGDGINMAVEVGAEVVDMQHVQLLPMPADRFGPTINIDNVIFINKDGKRYVKEDGRRDELCLSTFAQRDGQYFMINDSKIITEDRKSISGEDLDALIKKDRLIEAATLEDLAKAIDVPLDALKETIDKFNESVDKKSDEFGRKVWANKIDKAPYYATLRFPALHHTMGGIKIDADTRVLDKDNNVIPGLYAAGEVAGGIHGANRLGGNAITDIMVFGRKAGEKVIKENESK